LSDESWDKWFENRRWPLLGGSIFGDIDDIDEAFREMEETMQRRFEETFKKAPRNLFRQRTLPDGSKVLEWGPLVYGYRLTIGPDGKPEIREFSNVKPQKRLEKRRTNTKEEREPLIDVLQTKSEVKVIVELPGVEKEEIKLHGANNNLTISVDTPERKYHKELELPAKVDTKKMKTSYKNGVLEITLEKKKKPESKPVTL
jgi:HSP20 family protein